MFAKMYKFSTDKYLQSMQNWHWNSKENEEEDYLYLINPWEFKFYPKGTIFIVHCQTQGNIFGNFEFVLFNLPNKTYL